jgi:hydroxyquinol 1,2-dioxygenase
MSQAEQASAGTRRNLSDEELTRAVIASFDGATEQRTKVIMQSLVKHLHAFAQEVQLSEDEWFKGIDFLTRTGHITDDKRQEFVLLSDVLGLSMLVVGMNSRLPAGATASGEPLEAHEGSPSNTEATVFGPFFVAGSPSYQNGDDIANGAPGEPCYIEGHVRSVSGEPIAGAHIEIWQADDRGFYDVQYAELDEARGRGNLYSDAQGRYWFWTVKPEAYPIPHDGPVGDLLQAAERSPMRPAHVHFMIQAPGYQRVITHVFAAGDQYLDTDAVFGVKSSLITDFTRHEPGSAPDGRQIDTPFYTASYDFVLAPME